MIVHAGLLALRLRGLWRGVLVEGPSGAGKSDLALRALEAGFRLVADDRVILWTSAGRLFGRAPDALQGLMEVRGLDVLPAPTLRLAEVGLLVRAGDGERMRDPDAAAEFLGLRVPMLQLDLKDASAPAKLALALARL